MNRVNISEQNSHEGLIKLREGSNRIIYQGDIMIHSLPHSLELGSLPESRTHFSVTLVAGKPQLKGEKKNKSKITHGNINSIITLGDSQYLLDLNPKVSMTQEV